MFCVNMILLVWSFYSLLNKFDYFVVVAVFFPLSNVCCRFGNCDVVWLLRNVENIFCWQCFYSTMSIGIDVVNVGVSNSSCFFIFSIWNGKGAQKCLNRVDMIEFAISTHKNEDERRLMCTLYGSIAWKWCKTTTTTKMARPLKSQPILVGVNNKRKNNNKFYFFFSKQIVIFCETENLEAFLFLFCLYRAWTFNTYDSYRYTLWSPFDLSLWGKTHNKCWIILVLDIKCLTKSERQKEKFIKIEKKKTFNKKSLT